MTCFEAQKEFPAFWRRAMPLASRSALVAHLRGCVRCDSAFRAFALSAPVLHSERIADEAPQASRPPLNLVRPRRFAAARPVSLRPSETWRPWKIAAAASLMVVVGGVSAWSSARWPTESFADSVAGDSVEVDPVMYSSDNLPPDLFATDSSMSDSGAADLSTPEKGGISGQDAL